MQPTLFSVRFLRSGVPVRMTSDAELLQQSRAGHREAFAGLVERYQNLVCAVTFGGTGDRALAADLAQETFVTAWTALPTLRDESRFRSWLCGIARNLVGKARRKARPTEATGELVDPTPDAEAQIEDLRSEALVREILEDYVFPGTQLDTWSEAQPVLRDVESRSTIVGSTPDDEAAFAVVQGIPAEPMTVCAVRPHKLFT